MVILQYKFEIIVYCASNLPEIYVVNAAQTLHIEFLELFLYTAFVTQIFKINEKFGKHPLVCRHRRRIIQAHLVPQVDWRQPPDHLLDCARAKILRLGQSHFQVCHLNNLLEMILHARICHV